MLSVFSRWGNVASFGQRSVIRAMSSGICVALACKWSPFGLLDLSPVLCVKVDPLTWLQNLHATRLPCVTDLADRLHLPFFPPRPAVTCVTNAYIAAVTSCYKRGFNRPLGPL